MSFIDDTRNLSLHTSRNSQHPAGPQQSAPRQQHARRRRYLLGALSNNTISCPSCQARDVGRGRSTATAALAATRRFERPPKSELSENAWPAAITAHTRSDRLPVTSTQSPSPRQRQERGRHRQERLVLRMVALDQQSHFSVTVSTSSQTSTSPLAVSGPPRIFVVPRCQPGSSGCVFANGSP
jgi:hypothetical protein